VAFRNKHPEETKVNVVLKELEDYKADTSQVVKVKTDHCL
jgi:hypothetical protein